ncbi:hypothetical protein SKAU_G00337990 [Synaphobranchus kaupii]|uniref:Uncharacterized protein n=1 Tax=Synaphobranchus kaupii TaxID=118154 RepID=A0A9Q1EMH0_SYNKA|nr:hypothetical protein SKAU_G00337990 [Synaphobranchus kaupii]
MQWRHTPRLDLGVSHGKMFPEFRSQARTAHLCLPVPITAARHRHEARHVGRSPSPSDQTRFTRMHKQHAASTRSSFRRRATFFTRRTGKASRSWPSSRQRRVWAVTPPRRKHLCKRGRGTARPRGPQTERRSLEPPKGAL